MTHPLIIVTLLFVLPLCTADSMMQMDGESSVFHILLKRIGELEENVRKSDRKLEEIPILRRRLDDAERRLSHMQDLQYRLEKSEEKIYELENRVKKKNCNESQDSSNSSTVSISESNVTKEVRAVDLVSGSAWVPRSVSTTMFSKAEKRGNVEKFVLFKNRTQRAIMKEEKTEKRSIPSKVAFTAMFSSTPIQLTPGRSLLFDRVDYNEGNAYDKTSAIMKEEKTERRSIVTKVAFTALFSTFPIQLLPGRSLLFDRVDYNEGNAYDKTSGIMTCPITGTYFFYTNVLANPNALDVATELIHEGNSKGETYAFGGSNYDQSSTSAILHCRTGEQVWVRTIYGSQIHGGGSSSFSGFILWIDADASSSN